MTAKSLPFSVDDLASIVSIDLPAHLCEKYSSHLQMTWVSRAPQRSPCDVIDHHVSAKSGHLTSVDIRLPDAAVVRIATSAVTTPATHALLEASDWTISDHCLQPVGKTRWRKTIPTDASLDAALRATVKGSWSDGVSFSVQSAETSGDGLRTPQSGALHAIAAHWSVKRTPALVIMPTGTGKTDTMIAAMVMRSPRRTLVLVPSDVLRSQVSSKFQTLGVLRTAGVLADGALNPIVGVPLSSDAFTEGADDLKACNVVVSTVAMIDQTSEHVLAELSQLFDVVFVDEVHHAPAKSWRRILDNFPDRSLVGFSATPFREDAQRIPGSIIYNFPLRLAQTLGYFRRLSLKLIDEPDLVTSHLVIAQAAVAQLHQDDHNGFSHVILARTSTKKHADQLLDEIYAPNFPELNPIALHSSTPKRSTILENIRNGFHRIIICVDMFGEGFDMPSLKIAALHAIHKSLAITLQFTGRFTRSTASVGDATIVANIANEHLTPAVEELYAESADWQDLLPRLSEMAIGNELKAAEFESAAKRQDLPESSLFDLFSLRPSLSAIIFRASSFSATSVAKALPKDTHLHAQWISEQNDLVICVTKSSRNISWTSSKDAFDEIWELWLIAFNQDKGLLYVNASSRSSLLAEFAKRITNQSANLIRGEGMFRALGKMKRLTLYNVGLYGRGRLRFRMFTGRDVAEQITTANQANNAKSNLFGSGYEDGIHKTIGVSHKGRTWSLDTTNIPDWREWCDQVAEKITDDKIKTDEFLKHTLNPKAVKVLPNLEILAVMEPDVWLSERGIASQVAISATAMAPVRDLCISAFERRGDALIVTIAHEDNAVVELQFNWGPTEEEQRIVVIKGPETIFVDGTATPWSDYLLIHPFTVLFMDGSELQGGVHLQRSDGEAILFDQAHAQGIDWGDTPIKVESKWKGGNRRPDSIQGRWIDKLLEDTSEIIFDDDDANECADIVEISYNDLEIVCRLYHCKYSHGNAPGRRVDDVQIVCAQATRSAKWANSPESLFSHLQLREAPERRGGRPTRFERGSLRQLIALKRLVSKRRFSLHIYVVQPGLLVSQIDRNISLVLGASDNFIHELTGYPLTVIGGRRPGQSSDPTDGNAGSRRLK
ncbi:MAG: DEAD/DEAH box helicase family protein [Pseudomonadota bacterium]